VTLGIEERQLRDYHNDFDHIDPDFGERLYEITDDLRRQCPVAHGKNHGGFVAVSRYEDVYAVVHDYSTFSSADGITLPTANGNERAVPLECDPPDNRLYRKMLMPYFSPDAVASYETLITNRVDELLDAIADSASPDLAVDFAIPLPALVTCDVMGLPPADAPNMIEWQKRCFESSDPEAIAAFFAYLGEQLDQRREEPRGDLMTSICAFEVNGARMRRDQAIAMAHLVAAAGFETTGSALGHLLRIIGENPGLRAGLIAGTEDLPAVVEESLRYETPLQGVARTVRKPTRIAGEPLGSGDRIAILLGSANRDPAKFDNPDAFDPKRTSNRHLSFGSGVHLCLGIHLARAEMRIAVERLLARFPNFEIVGDPVLVHRNFIRALERLPVSLHDGAGVPA
jgi:cytochrome P450